MAFSSPVGIFIGSAGFLAGYFACWMLRRFLASRRRTPPPDAPSASAPESMRPALPTVPPASEPAAHEPHLDQLLLGMVEVIDEIELMKSEAPPETIRSLALIQGRLEDKITLAEGELIRETQWQPALQRAVKVEPAEAGQTEARVLRSRATGLKHRGRMIRKQEVVISQP